MECLADSTLPDELRKHGYRPEFIGEGQRVLAHGITERFSRNADGSLALLTPGSTAIVETITHAGIVTTERYSFEMGNPRGQSDHADTVSRSPLTTRPIAAGRPVTRFECGPMLFSASAMRKRSNRRHLRFCRAATILRHPTARANYPSR
jgi:hypothetical protein